MSFIPPDIMQTFIKTTQETEMKFSFPPPEMKQYVMASKTDRGAI